MGKDETVIGIPIPQSYAPTPPTRYVSWVSQDNRGCGSWTCNLLWLIFGGGFIMGLLWGVVGCLLCVTIVFIPCGLQVLKIAGFIFFPFGKSIERTKPACACPECLGNVLWLPIGLIMFLAQISTSVVLFLSIIGIPFGIQHLKLSFICLWPFGTEVTHLQAVPHVVQEGGDAPQPPSYQSPPVV
mmetsp:Transcript_33983/g.96274  ORF Transcript_33983/g.96274 Transcript_33983/m.96274 type:complete len:185 (-) Transcript_33983:84-638(-)